tara:strand:+ start:821 stop:1357 length:537 start_codon:yes stop_codon:yes gene_type:complete
MNKIITFLSFFVLIISLTISTAAKKVSKKNAEYTGKAIVEKDIMKDAGMWFMFMNECEGTFAKAYKEKLGLLSWEDYKNFNKGNAIYQGGNYTVLQCDKNTSADIREWWNEILAYIKYELNTDNDISESQITETKSNNETKSNSKAKERLKELKSLFEDGLITQEEYDVKRQEILDEI